MAWRHQAINQLFVFDPYFYTQRFDIAVPVGFGSWTGDGGANQTIVEYPGQGKGNRCGPTRSGMPIASLKIDKSFIDGINAPLNASNELVKTVLTLASGLGMATVAEGVETREQIDFLAENGCSAIQGYIFSQALSGSDFATYLKGSAESIAAVMA